MQGGQQSFAQNMMSSKRSMLSDQSTADMLSSEIKKIRLRISDYYRSNVIEPIMLKLWKLLLEVPRQISLYFLFKS